MFSRSGSGRTFVPNIRSQFLVLKISKNITEIMILVGTIRFVPKLILFISEHPTNAQSPISRIFGKEI